MSERGAGVGSMNRGLAVLATVAVLTATEPS